MTGYTGCMSPQLCALLFSDLRKYANFGGFQYWLDCTSANLGRLCSARKSAKHKYPSRTGGSLAGAPDAPAVHSYIRSTLHVFSFYPLNHKRCNSIGLLTFVYGTPGFTGWVRMKF
jgi:hypothetical protein